MFAKRNPVLRVISALTIACFLPVAVGCDGTTSTDPARTRVVLTDSSGEETIADVHFESEIVPTLAILEGGAPAQPERIFTRATTFKTSSGKDLSFEPNVDGTVAIRLGKDVLPITVSWNTTTSTLVFAGSALSSLTVKFEGDRAFDREAGLFALSTVATLAVSHDAPAGVEPISTGCVILGLAVIGLAAYLACITLGCNYMCKNNCGSGGVESCGCGIVTSKEGTDWGYSCKCKPCPTPTPSPSSSPSPTPSPSPSSSPSPSPSPR